MNLFEKTNIKNMNLKNRFFKAASWEALATETGHMTDELFKIYKDLAKGGVGTIITGYAFVTKDEQPNPRMMGIYDDSFIDEYKKLTQMVHNHDTNIVMQIVYGGSMSTLTPPSQHILGPSSIENERTKITPTEMTKDDINMLIEAFSNAAYRVKQAGFDGVELHAAHGYLFSQFLCPHYNTRTDEYGENIENRARIILDTVKAIRNLVGKDFPIMIKLNSEDFMEDGLTSEESIAVSKVLKNAGIDAIEVSGGHESSLSVLNGNLGPARTKISVDKNRESYFLDHAARLAKEVNIPIILTGGNRHFDVIENLLNTTDIAYFALARPLISEPNLINEWKEGNYKKPKCVSCNGCYNTYGKRCVLNIKNN
jgi:2,4-dienoyl-CoA reductase-like NADH-dependent reductase (Old Yellow Enzyme family)